MRRARRGLRALLILLPGIAAATALAALPRPCAAQGSTTAFSMDAFDARAFAMGGVLTVLPKDATAIRWNPALMVFTRKPEGCVAYSEPFSGLSATHPGVAATFPLGEVVGAAAGGATPVRRSAAGGLLMGSSFDLSEGGSWSELQLGAGYAYAFNSYVSGGAGLRFLTNSTDVADAQVSGFSLDLGAAVLLSPRVEAGAVIRSALGRVKWKSIGTSETPPTILDAGLGLIAGPRLDGEVGFEISGAQRARVRAGAEYGFLEGQPLKVRAGTRLYLGTNPRAVLTAGAGFRTGSLHVDVAAALDQGDALGTTRAVSVGYSF